MKVLKFGGTSVGSVESILSLKNIVTKEAKEQSVIVVVSALGGITDKLIETSRLALAGDERYREEFEAIVDRHHKMIDTIITDTKDRERLFTTVDSLLEQLRSIYFGVFLIHDLSEKTQDAIVAYGERLSSNIVATLIKGAKWFDSRTFIKTEDKQGKHVLDAELTNKLVRQTFADLPRISLVPGFISKDRVSGETTNLGRGGSDTSAAAIAAATFLSFVSMFTAPSLQSGIQSAGISPRNRTEANPRAGEVPPERPPSRNREERHLHTSPEACPWLRSSFH